MDSRENVVDAALHALKERVLAEPGLRAEHDAARPRFFDGERDPSQHEDARSAERRFDEWFLLERPSDALGGVPVDALAETLAEEGLLEPAEVAALRASFCGVFEVTSVEPGEGVWLRDLLGGGEYPLADSSGSTALESRDVLIGRLYSLGDAGHWLSRSAAFFRSEKLHEALKRDLEAARKARRGVPRLSQLELEAMFWRRRDELAREAGGAVGAARTLLESGGLDEDEVEDMFALLARSPLEPTQIVPGHRDALSDVLERLAFQTAIDLESARRILLAAWQELSPELDPRIQSTETRDAASAAERREVDARTALEAFDRGREEGKDLERLFADLERDLGLEPDPEDELEPAPDFPGVVGAMVEEFLWETEREHGAELAQSYAGLRRLSEFGEKLGALEDLTARELLAFAAVWLPEKGRLAGAEDARATLAALRAFCAWSQESQDLPLSSEFSAELDRLADSLPRIADANAALEPIADEHADERFELVAVEPGGRARVRDPHGREHEAGLPPAAASKLAPGDRLRGRRSGDGRFALARSYPPESAPILAG